MSDSNRSDPHPRVVEGMMAFTVAGFPVFPLAANKRPGVPEWGPLRTTPPDLLQVEQWGSQRYDGYAVICGATQRLIMIDFEAGFMGHLMELRVRLEAAGVLDVFESWLAGYCVETPSGGMHVAVRLGDGVDMPGNQKLAMASRSEVLVETRAEGGYVVGPGSGGRCHPSGGDWVQRLGGPDTVAYCIVEEWVMVSAVLGSFDVSPPAPTLTVPTRSTVGFPNILRVDDSWIDTVKDSLPTLDVVLDNHGWVLSGRRDQFGTHWVRPGKTRREGHSASVSDAGRLWVHSTNAELPTGVSLDVVDVLWCYETGNDRQPPTLEERTAWLKAQRPAPAARPGVGTAPIANEVADLNLPADFWQARPYLTHIHQAALSMRLSPDAVWAAIRCFYAATIPWNHRLPGDGTLDYIAINVGASGAGKSQAKHAAWRLLEHCWDIDGIHFPVPVGSGEGMTEIFLDRTNEGRHYKNRGCGFYADEGKFLLDIGGRAGSTTIQAIKQMWSGELTGSVAATAERHRWLEPRAVRATLLISTTPDIAAAFLRQDLTDEGLPQRIAWAWAHYNHPDTKPDWPGPLNITRWDHNRAPTETYTVDLDPQLAALIDNHRLAAAKGQVNDLHEGHATYAILKSAAIHAHIEGRMTGTTADWKLATQEWEVTRTVRQHISRSQLAGLHDRNVAAGQARAHQRLAETDVFMERAIEALRKKLKLSEEPLMMRQIKDHLRSFAKRHGINYREVIALAIERGWARKTANGGLEIIL